MRFAALQSGNTSDYVNAGRAVAGSAASMFDKQRKTGPDYTGLSKVAMAANTAEKIAANEAQADVTTAAIKARGDVQRAKVVADANVQLGEQKAEYRKAGLLPAIGKIVGSTFKKDPVPPPPRQQVAPVQPNYPDYPEIDYSDRPTAPTFEPFTPPSSGDTSGTPSPSTPAAAGGSISQQQLEKMVLNRGRDPELARTLSAIAMGESGGNPTIDTVQSGLDPDKSNEYSIGLWQINSNVHMDRLARRGYSIEDLRDPQKNLDLALEIYDSQGLNAWGAYSNGSYRQYLQ